MPQLPFADAFLTGSLLTIVLPLALLIAIAIWYMIEVRRVPTESSPALPSQDVVDASGSGTVSDVTPADPPAERS
jgi:hypothetical protein